MQKLTDLLSEILECDIASLPETTSFEEIASWDSLKHVMLVVGIEAMFQTKLSAEEIQKMMSLAEIKRVLGEKDING
jgi:acyl carrier protein